MDEPRIVPHSILPMPTLMPTRCVDDLGVSRWRLWNLENVVEWRARGDFEFVGWDYERRPPNTCLCVKCGGDKFLVGNSPDCPLTIIKCPECGWERVVHEG